MGTLHCTNRLTAPTRGNKIRQQIRFDKANVEEMDPEVVNRQPTPAEQEEISMFIRQMKAKSAYNETRATDMSGQ